MDTPEGKPERPPFTRIVFVRMQGVPPLDRCIRVSAGDEPDLALLADALPQALAAPST